MTAQCWAITSHSAARWRHSSRCSLIRGDAVGIHVDRTLDGAVELAGIIW
jgi:hypothetical protein